MAQNKALELSIRIAGKVDKSLTTAISQTNTLMGSLTGAMSKAGTAGLAAMGALATGTVAALAACTKEAAKFENDMSDVVKVVDGMADEMGKASDKLADIGNGRTYAENYAVMKETLKDLSTQIPYTFEDLTRLAAAAGQSGKSFDDLTKTDFLRDIAMWGTAMDISADQAGDWGAKWEQAFNMDHEQVMEVADVINYLGNSYATTAAEIAQSVNDAASMGQLAGVDVKATAAIAASMQAMGVSADSVGTSVKRIYTNITKGSTATAAQEAAFARLGFSATEIAKAMQTDGTGTLLKVFDAVNRLPGEEKLSTLNALFGQWAIEGGAKITQNLSLLTGMLEEVSDPSVWRGSMEKEFIIKAATPEAIETMLGSARSALKDDIGTAFLPAYKEFGLSQIEFIRRLRENMPELTQLSESLGTLASRGVEKLGEAMERALPYIQKGLDYLLDNGSQAVSTLGKLAAVFVGMKFAPGIESLLSGAGNLLLGSSVGGSGKRTGGLLGGITSLFKSGQSAGAAGAGFFSAFRGAAGGNGFDTTLGAALSSLIGGNGIKGTAGLLEAAAETPGLLSGYQSVGSVLRGAVEDSRAAQWLGGIASPLGSFADNVSGLAFTLLGRSNTAAPGASLAGKLAGGVMGTLSSGGSLLRSIYAPLASGFGSLLAGALPVVGVISAIIAVVSILGDHLEDIRGIIQNVFGDTGVAVFDKFLGVLQNVGSFITGLFADGGVANALAPLRESITGLFGEDAGAAFDGVTTVLQSVMGVIGQLVTFSQTTVRPIIEDIFSFLTQTVMPVILQTVAAAAPHIASIISGVGSAVMTAAQIIGEAIDFLMPFIELVITDLLHIGQAVIPAVLAAVGAFAEGISGVIAGARTILEGVIDYITGIFSGNWRMAWEGVRSIFKGIFDTLGALFKAPINAVIALINKAIEGINGLGITIPEWVPLLGGKSFALSIPEIPMLAKGGFTDGVSIAGEAGREAVISFERGVRTQNIATWAQAGRMLGVQPLELAELPESGGDGGSFTFAPSIVIQGNADADVLEQALRRAKEEFEAWYEQMLRRRARTAY